MNIMIERAKTRYGIKCLMGLLALFIPAALSAKTDAGVAEWSLGDTAMGAAAPVAVPPLAQNLQADKQIMLTLSVDHQLFLKAYNDYEDIDQNIREGERYPIPDITYRHDFKYAGYFDSGLCYAYAEGVFAATAATDKGRYCKSGGWSGNFLNWATMTRMDLVRLVLYGGYRHIDTGPVKNSGSTTARTVLERSYLPQDAHSFTKYYAGDDLADLADGLNPDSGITICNTTKPDNKLKDKYSQDKEWLAQPPLMRVVAGDYSLWASNERYQCLAKDEIPEHDRPGAWALIDDRGYNGNFFPEITGIPAAWSSPRSAQVTDYIVRVDVCVAGSPQESFCKAYSSGDSGVTSMKPVGLLQRQSETGGVKFGLITGSYNANKSFGALRKNIAPFDEELNADGTFVYPTIPELLAADSAINLPLANSIIGNLNALRIVDYKFISAGESPEDRWKWSGTYHVNTDEQSAPNCFWGYNSFKNGQCRNWGNPFSELLGESYLYFAGKAKQAVEENDAGLIPGLSVAEWAPLAGEQTGGLQGQAEFSCPNMNVVGFNSSAVSYDSAEEAASDTGFKNLAGQAFTDLFGEGIESPQARLLAGIGAEETRALTVQDAVKLIGRHELDADTAYFVGRSEGEGDDGQCTPKYIAGRDLSAVTGTCPEAPNLRGSYWGAGLAYMANTHDVIPATPQKESIKTFGIDLAGALPSISLPLTMAMNGPTVEIVPACRNLGIDEISNGGTSNKGNCALVNFKPISVWQQTAADVFEGMYYVGWEDSEQGGDYDLDLSGTIAYKLDLKKSKLEVFTHIIYESANDPMEFGFVISGTDADGAHFPSGIGADDSEGDTGMLFGMIGPNEVNEALRAQAIEALKNIARVPAQTVTSECTASTKCESVSGNDRLQKTTFTVNSEATAKFLESPLYYAAKWGGFNDSESKIESENYNGIIDDGEWDGSTYGKVSNPSRLESTLGKLLDNIVNKPVAGTGAAIATTALTGEGAILSTLFLPEAGEGADKVRWVGRLNGLFRADNETWEDSATPYGVRTDADNIVRFYVEGSKTVFDRYKASRDELGNLVVSAAPTQVAVDYSKLKPIWNARDQLAALRQNGPAEGAQSPHKGITQNRTYLSPANNGRYIFTSVDSANGLISHSDVLPFTSTSFGSDANVGLGANNFKLLNVETADHAGKVVDFVRGKEGIAGFRNRTVALEAGADPVPWLLGDITHSTPAMVGRPSSLYDSKRLNDLSYSKFRSDYANRRLVTYVGANDGMLHAFNGGFSDIHEEKTGTGDDEVVENFLKYNTLSPEGGAVAHPLGAELWSYVPYNLLPQLKWLTDPNYRHVYYVDSSVNKFDVNIFPHSDDLHPEGWGTIIVVGMRFGGSNVSLDLDEESGPRQFRSAYMIFDVTDPEREPKLLGEISHDELGYTLGDIDVISFRDPHTSGSYTVSDGTSLAKNQWYLVFGSGPNGADSLRTAESNQSAKIFTLDLNRLVGGKLDLKVHDLGQAKSYVGGITSVDWNNDFDDDMLYFGTVGTGTAAGEPKGSLMQASLEFVDGDLTLTPSTLLIDVDLPFSREPLAIQESGFGGYWIFAASGKFLVQDDLDDIDDNKAFGIRVNNPAPGENGKPWLTSSPLTQPLKDITSHRVVTRMGKDASGNAIRTYAVVDGMDEILPEDVTVDIRENYSGWVRDFSNGELSDTRPFYLGSTLGLTTFLPSVSGCSPSGKSRLYVLNMFNGLPQTESAQFVLQGDNGGGILTPSDSGTVGELNPFVEIDSKANDVSDGTPTIQQADGGSHPGLPEAKPGVPVRRSWREVPMDELEL